MNLTAIRGRLGSNVVHCELHRTLEANKRLAIDVFLALTGINSADSPVDYDRMEKLLQVYAADMNIPFVLEPYKSS